MPRLLFLVSSNNRIDRDGEIVTKQALIDYVNFAHDEAGGYIGDNDLLWWHGGDAIGKIIEADVIHGFLVEIAIELEDAPVIVGKAGKEEQTTIKQMWDMIELDPTPLGVSQGFQYLESDRARGVYNRIFKHESSILPIESASNPYTLVKVMDV